MNRKVEIMFDKENRQREAKKRLKEKQVALINGSKKMVVVGATTLVLAGAFSCSQASAYDRYDDNSYRGLGYMCFSDEVGSDGDGSYVSPGTGDYGGISYGLYQFSTTTGSAKDFVNWSKDNNYPEIYKIFQDAGNPKAGTPAFGKAWKKCYKELEGKFEEAQTEFAMGELINPGYEKVKKETGIDLKKSRARTEFLISTANQFGRGGIVTLFKEVQNKGIKLSDDMSDTELLGIMCQHKYDTVDYHFRSSSSAVQRSARLRFKREKKELLKIAKEEEGPKLDEIDTNKEQTEATKTETSSSKTSKKEVVNDTADKYQGKGITYDFGEKNYKSGSLDCSGLISQMMNDMGVKVDAGNTNALAFSNNSKKISKDEIQPGDLVFWNDDNGSRHNSVYHIGMYVGNDTIVDCSPSHNGVGTRKLSQCKDTGDMHYTYGRYTKLENKMKDYAQKIVESIDEFDDVITVDDSNIEKDYKKVEEKTTELKEAINENAKEDNNQKEETSKEDREDNKEDNNVQEENKKDNETSLDKSEDASNKDEFESIIDEDKTDKSEEENNQKEESSNEDKEEETSKESNESSKEDKTEESSEDKEETNDSTLDKTLVVGDSHAKALEDKLKDNKDTEVEATVGASAYVYLNDTNYFGDKLLDKLPKDSDKINKVIISLGVNNIEGNSNINDVKKVIDKIESMYPGKDIYFMKVNHVGDKYKDGDVDKTNKMIDDLNKEIENYVKDKDKVKIIDASKGLETEGKLTETSDGLHVKDNDKLIDNLEKGIEENKKDNETSLDKSEDASNKDEFESIIDEDKTDKSVETSKEEDKSNENNQKEESSKEDKSEETSKEDKEDSSNKEESAVEKEETSKEEDNQKEESTVDKQEETTESSKEEELAVEKEETSKEEDNQKEEIIESSKEDKSEESSKEDNNVQEENNQKEETTESSKEEEPAVEKEETSKEDKLEESSKEYNNVQESTKETSNEDKEENVVKEQKETSKEEDKSEVKQTVQDKSNESSKEEKPVVEEQKSVNDNQESATETSKEDNSESQKENSRVDELHSRLQNNLFGRILMS